MLNRDNISTFETLTDELQRRASMIDYHVRAKRVTHTVAAVIRTMLSIAQLCRVIQSDKNFLMLLHRVLTLSWDTDGGSWEFETYDDGTVWIKGSFRVKDLRHGLMTVPQGKDTIDG